MTQDRQKLDLSRVFDRFYRTDEARNRSEGGTGLGLAIAQLIAKAHGGRITVESVVGEGSTFTSYLPLSGPRESNKKGTKNNRIYFPFNPLLLVLPVRCSRIL